MNLDTASSWRRGAEWAIPLLAVGVALLLPLLVWGRLPEPMAVHWDTSGTPDGSLPRIVDLLVMAGATAAVGLAPLLATRLRMPRSQARILVAVATGGSGLLATLRVLSVRANLDVAQWEAAGQLGGTTMLLTFVLAVLLGAGGAWLAGDRPDHQPPSHPVPPAEVVTGQAVVWSGRATGRLGVVTPSVLLAAAALGAWLVPGDARTVLIVVLPIVALALTTLGQAQVTIGPRGIAVGLGWLGWPRLRVPVEEVADVTVEDVQPMAYGGWGLRLVPKVTAVVIRRGEGIRVERPDGRTLVVTVDDAARGAGVLLAHRDAAVSR